MAGWSFHHRESLLRTQSPCKDAHSAEERLRPTVGCPRPRGLTLLVPLPLAASSHHPARTPWCPVLGPLLTCPVNAPPGSGHLQALPWRPDLCIFTRGVGVHIRADLSPTRLTIPARAVPSFQVFGAVLSSDSQLEPLPICPPCSSQRAPVSMSQVLSLLGPQSSRAPTSFWVKAHALLETTQPCTSLPSPPPLSPPHSLCSSHSAASLFLQTAGMILPQSLCTYCFLCVNASSTHFLQVCSNVAFSVSSV